MTRREGPADVATVVDAPAAAAPERRALIVAAADDGESTCTYGDLQREVRRWATTLAARGVGRGSRVALVDWGGVRAAAVTLGAASVGAATAHMNPLLTARELTQLVDRAGCGPVGVAHHASAAALAEALATAWGPGTAVLDEPDEPDEPDWGAGPGADRTAGPDADALVLFTSGTTGLPKPVPLTHRAVTARIQAYRAPFDPDRAPTTTIMCVPSFHVGGILGLLLNLYGGDTTVVQPRFDAGRWLALVQRHRVTSAFLVPTMLARILDHPDLATTDVSSLRMISYGAAAAPTDLIHRAMAHWPQAGFANVFGQTETLGAYTTLTPADHGDPRRVGSVGRPLPGVEVRVVDPATSDDVEAGAVGEIWVRADQVVGAPHHRDEPPPTAGGDWLHTGDLARRDADGYLYPVGRRSDVINRGGEKFPPSEVGEVLRAHPAVADVVVAGIPDMEMGERVGAAVVLRPGTAAPSLEELRTWCATALASFKRPERVVFVDHLPVNELGKLPRATAVALITGSSAPDGPTTDPGEGATPP